MSEPISLCQPWGSTDRICCNCDSGCDECGGGDAGTSMYTDDELLLMASNILHRKTCYMYPGLCEYTIRPCPPCFCRCSPCHCGRKYPVLPLSLEYPLVSVSEVRINGVVVDPETYRVDDYSRLVRLGGLCWPSCQDLAGDPATNQVLEVDIVTGRTPPLDLQYAAEVLAVELRRACGASESCKLPSHVTGVVRQGVSFGSTNKDIFEVFANGLLGLPDVDRILSVYECKPGSFMRVGHPLIDGRQIIPNTGGA